MTSAPPSVPAPFSRRQLLVLGGSIASAMVFAWLTRLPELTLGGDDSTYLLLAEAVRQGRYVDLFLPGTPAHAQYPPGLPLYIATIQVLGGDSVALIQATNVVLMGISAALLARAVASRFDPWLGVAAGSLMVLNPLIIRYAGAVLSETLFVTLTVATLTVVAQPCRCLRTRSWATAFALGLAAFMTRSIGITLVFALVLGLLVCRRWRLALVGCGSFGLLTAWFAYTRWAADRTLGWSYANDLVYVQPSRPVDLVVGVLSNARHYLAALPSRVFALPSIPDMPVEDVVWLVMLAFPMVVGAWHLWRRWPTAFAYGALFTGVLVIFPFSVLRLVVPLIPVLVVALIVGIRELAASLGATRPGGIALAAALVLSGLAFAQDVREAVARQRCRTVDDPTCGTPAERTWLETAQWIRIRLPKGAVVASAKPSTLYRISGHQGVPSRILMTSKVEQVLAPAGSVTHIMATHLWAYERRDLPIALRSVCGRLRPLPAPHPTALVLEVLPPDSAQDPAGCRALQNLYEQTGDEADPRAD